MPDDKYGDSGHAKMRPRARLISLIGDELISDEPVAVVELVKNAYDADATAVIVRFEGKDPAAPDQLIIQDDGHGMSLETIMSGWFEPGTILKKSKERSPGGRRYLGAKGIGRFAAARLSPLLYLETKQRDQEHGVSVLLDWGRFDDDSYLDEITIDYQSKPLPHLSHGTKLDLADLRERKHWSEEDFRALHNRLSRLISPFEAIGGGPEVDNFKIDLHIPEFPDLTGIVEPHEITRKPKYRLTGTLSHDGRFDGVVEIDGTGAKALADKKLGSKDEVVACGALQVEIRAWDRDRPGLTPYMLAYDQSLRGIRQILDEYCGVSIYRDGFRVHPYGERGLDWLSLDTRSRQNPTMRLANNQIVAALRISREQNQDLVDRTTREGLVHNFAYESLIIWFKRVLALLEEARYEVRPREERRSPEVSTLYEPFDMSEVVAETDRHLGVTHPVTKLVKQKDEDIREGVKRLQDHYSRVLLAAGLGQLVDVVIHEIGAPLGRATRDIGYLRRLLAKPDEGGVEQDGKEVSGLFTRIDAWLEQISNLRLRLIPKAAGKRGRATTFVVQEEIADNISLFEALIAKQQISCKIRAPKDPIAVHMSRSNLGQIIANLLDNSIYWLTRHHGDGNGGRIDIKLTSEPKGFRVCLSDDGPGVDEEDRERIFEQEFSRKPNGMGLGLFIARQVMEPYGRLLFRDDCALPGACFEATFQQRVGL